MFFNIGPDFLYDMPLSVGRSLPKHTRVGIDRHIFIFKFHLNALRIPCRMTWGWVTQCITADF